MSWSVFQLSCSEFPFKTCPSCIWRIYETQLRKSQYVFIHSAIPFYQITQLLHFIMLKPSCPRKATRILKKNKVFFCSVLIWCQVHFTLLALQIMEHRLENWLAFGIHCRWYSIKKISFTLMVQFVSPLTDRNLSKLKFQSFNVLQKQKHLSFSRKEKQTILNSPPWPFMNQFLRTLSHRVVLSVLQNDRFYLPPRKQVVPIPDTE